MAKTCTPGTRNMPHICGGKHGEFCVKLGDIGRCWKCSCATIWCSMAFPAGAVFTVFFTSFRQGEHPAVLLSMRCGKRKAR